MKKWMIFVAGIVFGFVLSFIIDKLVNNEDSEPQPKEKVESNAEKEQEPEPERIKGLHLLDEPGEIIKEESVKVFQVLAEDAALANGKNEYGDYYGTIYLIVNNEGKYYYDDEMVKVPTGKVFRQIGVYQYPTRQDIVKTVPVIMIMDN
jgi:hypothetical protein